MCILGFCCLGFGMIYLCRRVVAALCFVLFVIVTWVRQKKVLLVSRPRVVVAVLHRHLVAAVLRRLHRVLRRLLLALCILCNNGLSVCHVLCETTHASLIYSSSTLIG
mmetsp:Transcript_24926/g.37171  ORF Transcript_24926/g.37171 Transcript_24926/m.37171 type:complete len:108 (-) Transcript_24926:518-841(-)